MYQVFSKVFNFVASSLRSEKKPEIINFFFYVYSLFRKNYNDVRKTFQNNKYSYLDQYLMAIRAHSMRDKNKTYGAFIEVAMAQNVSAQPTFVNMRAVYKIDGKMHPLIPTAEKPYYSYDSNKEIVNEEDSMDKYELEEIRDYTDANIFIQIRQPKVEIKEPEEFSVEITEWLMNDSISVKDLPRLPDQDDESPTPFDAYAKFVDDT
jgi:hypothetical protein